MLSIEDLDATGKRYLTELSTRDYYTVGGEPPGTWLGKGAAALGLYGQVDTAAFEQLYDGFSPDGARALVQNAGKDRDNAWDCTFSAPKSVSVWWAMADEEIRKSIQSAQQEAVSKAMSWLEQQTYTRRGKGGKERIPVDLVVAAFEHGTSREADPDLHTHCVVMNVGVGADGKTGTIASHPLYVNKIAAGRLYRAELSKLLQERHGIAVLQPHLGNLEDYTAPEWDTIATQLRQQRGIMTDKTLLFDETAAGRIYRHTIAGLAREHLGVEVAAHSKDAKNYDLFEVEGISPALVREFSKRRYQILEQLKTVGETSAKASSIATLETRKGKDHAPRQDLFKLWQQTGAAFGYQPPAQPSTKPDDKAQRLEQAIAAALVRLERQDATFTETALTKELAAVAPSHQLGVDEVIEAREAALNSDGVIHLGWQKGGPVFTTPTILALEKRLLRQIHTLHERNSHPVQAADSNAVLAARPTLRPEQQQAFTHLLNADGAVKGVSGIAGSGKTFLLDAARTAWMQAGYTCIGTAPTGKAAIGLQDKAQIPSVTLHKLISQLERGQLTLSPQHVVICDEAGMVSTPLLAQLVKHVEPSGAKLILVGDHRQLQAPIGPAGTFHHLGQIPGVMTELKDITRQRHTWERRAIQAFVKGAVREALTAYAERGQLHFSADKAAACEKLLHDWCVSGGLTAPAQHFIYTGEHWDAHQLNQTAQQLRQATGHLGAASVALNGYTRVYVGDRIVCRKNRARDGIANGDFGTVTAIEGKTVTLTLDRCDGQLVRQIDTEAYRHLALGYATTTYASQGDSVHRSYCLLSGPMLYKQHTYVQMSRGQQANSLYATRRDGGDQLAELAKVAGQSREKQMALAVLKRQTKLVRQ